MVAKGAVKPLDDTAKALATANYSADWLKYGTVKDVLYGAPNSANVKSFVWYSPKMFKDKGWTVPTTWDEMIALSDKIAATKVKPWCAGFESGTATGWPGTDWIEDVMLRTGGADNYDKWVTHQIPFNDPTVAAAFDKVGTILKNEKYVNGGYGSAKTIASTSFQDGGLPILAGDCAMHRQASFYSGMWPKGTNVGPDGDIFAFYFPTIDPTKGNPVLGGGEIVGAFNDKKPTKAVQNYMMSGDFVNRRAKLSNFLSANKQLDQANLLLADGKTVDPIMQLSAKILQDPKTVFRFDGSDMMPSAVGSGTFWKGMTNWITGQSTKQVIDTIEASWPKS
jgi:alpha-glucoside transport system substrate-binding protein